MPTTTIEIPYEAWLAKNDPDFYKDRQKVLLYEMPKGRKFYGRLNQQGAYADDHDNGGGD